MATLRLTRDGSGDSQLQKVGVRDDTSEIGDARARGDVERGR